MNVSSVMPGQSADATVPISFNPSQLSSAVPASNIIQTALKVSFQGQDKIVYFQVPFQLSLLFLENGKLEKDDYLNTWRQISEEHFKDISLGLGMNADTVTRKLESSRLFFIARRNLQQQEFLYFSAKTTAGAVLLLELSLGPSGSKICVKTRNTELVTLFHQAVQSLLN